MEIINVNHGIGNCFVDGKIKWIEINRNLRDYPGLYKSVLKHEKKHYNFKKESQHFLHDLKEIFNLKNSWLTLKFLVRHPKSFYQMSPIYKSYKGKWSLDNSNLLMWVSVTSLVLVGGVIW